ncbi:MAG: pilin [Patescibacteria group bacterium]
MTRFRLYARRFAAAAPLAAASFFLTANAMAGSLLVNNLQDTGETGFGTREPRSLPVTVGNIIKVFIGILGIFAVVLIVYAGFLWMNARGNEQQVEKAKSILTQAVIGLIIVLASYSIAGFVVRSLVSATTGT